MKAKALLFLLYAIPAMGQQPDSSSALFTMREAEWNFAKKSVMVGQNKAFAESFAEVSALFTDKWITNGQQFWKERKDRATVLKWEPEFMDIAVSGDFGISMGPWEAQEFRPNTKPLGYGYFFTIWKKNSSGVWKVILDSGIDSPPIAGKPHAFRFPVGADKTKPLSGADLTLSSEKEILSRESELLDAWKKEPVVSLYSSFLAKDAIMMNGGHLPSTSEDSVNKWIDSAGKTLLWEKAGAGSASSGDLGYTYGYLFIKGNLSKAAGHYVRIWKRQPDNKWLISLEMRSID
jgi:ketosteroid isomerase-like protein